MQIQHSYLSLSYKNPPQTEGFTTDDVPSNSAAAAARSRMWVSGFVLPPHVLFADNWFTRNVLVSTGLKCEQLTQAASVALQPGQQLTINCQVSYSVGSHHTHWIRQPSGKGLEWIGGARVGYDSYQKDSLKNKFSYSLDSSSNTVTLKGLNMQPEDSAVYYCARQSHWYKTLVQLYKNPSEPEPAKETLPYFWFQDLLTI